MEDASNGYLKVSSGTSVDLAKFQGLNNYKLPPGKNWQDIVGIAIAGSNDRIFTWYSDGKVTSGTSNDLDAYSTHNFSMPPGKKTSDIVGIAIAGSNDRVFVWYKGNTVSSGSSRDLDLHSAPQPCFPAPLKNARHLAGVGIAGSNDYVFYWYKDGKVSEGTTTDWDKYSTVKSFKPASTKSAEDIIGVGITGSNDRVYAWYRGTGIGKGWDALETKVDKLVNDWFKNNKLAPGMTIAVSKNGKVVLSKGYGFADGKKRIYMQDYHRSRIGSNSKIITALSAMKAREQNKLYLGSKLYGPSGVLKHPDYYDSFQRGIKRHKGLISAAISGSDDRVYAWYYSGKVSSGISTDLDKHSGPVDYSLPPGKTPNDIRAIGIAGSNDHVIVWYDDGTISSGTSTDLDKYYYHEIDETIGGKKFKGYKSKGKLKIVGIAVVGSNDKVHTWYENGKFTIGDSKNLHKYSGSQSYSVPPGLTPYDIKGIAIAGSNDHVYAWFTNFKVSSGTSNDLDKYISPMQYTTTSTFTPDDWKKWYYQMETKHLLTHSAGFAGSGDIGAANKMFGTTEASLGYKRAHQYILITRKLLFKPGTMRSYSNHGMGLVGHMISLKTGKSFYGYVRDNVLKPLNLHTRIIPYGEQINKLDAMPHSINDGKIQTDAIVKKQSQLGLAAGGWTASAGDMIRLMLATDKLANHKDILTANSLDIMNTPPFPATASDRAIGWEYFKNNTGGVKLDHNGSTGNGQAYLVKFLPGYISNSGDDLSNIYVAIHVNVGGSDISTGKKYGLTGKMDTLAGNIAIATSETDIPGYYDAF
jgi:CubicO group peptidase (beta-lactamase class C family)